MYTRFSVVFFYILLLLFGHVLLAKSGEYIPEGTTISMQSAIDPPHTLANIGNISYWLSYDGRSAIDPAGNSGVIYPRGTAGVIYEGGLVWGARVPGENGSSEIRVGGSTYRSGTQPLSPQFIASGGTGGI